MTTAEPTPRARRQAASRAMSLNIILLGLWLWLYRPVFDYLRIIFTQEDFRTNQILLILLTLLIASRLRATTALPSPLSPLPFSPFPLALALALGGSLAYLLVERFWDVNTLSATLFGLSSYGLLGLWLPPARWRQGLPAALLLIGTLPFGEHLQTFIGYPMRLLTAALVRDGLAAVGVGSVGVDTILIFENGISQIDNPCSGVRSLWTGMLFLTAATWIEQRPLNGRFLLHALILATLLLIANLARVAILVVVGQVAGWQLTAQMLHIPLGVLGFVLACAAVLALLRRQKPLTIVESPPNHQPPPRWFMPGMITAVFLMALLYTPRPQTGLAQAPPILQFPASLTTDPLPLKPDELAWLTRDGAQSADRLRFTWGDVSGSMILITSKTWRAHHRPERCFEVYGLAINDSRAHLVTPDLPIRFVSLGDDNGRNLRSAGYWFQSATHTTDDYSSRIWADLTPHPNTWVLVSFLFDGVYQPQELDDFYLALHNTVDNNLQSLNE